MTSDPKKHDELKDKELDFVSGGTGDSNDENPDGQGGSGENGTDGGGGGTGPGVIKSTPTKL